MKELVAHADESSSYLRKIRKPMVEKKRRERMNHSIAQLKSLIASTIKTHTAPMTRVDKADILELTVFHLTQLQQQQRSVSMAVDAAAYSAGYRDCAAETVRYLSSNRMTDERTVQYVNNHLHASMMSRSRSQKGNGSTSTPGVLGYHSTGNCVSTPLKTTDSVQACSSQINISGYSPIPYSNSVSDTPEMTSPYVSDKFASMSSSIDTSGYGSSLSSYCESNGTISTVAEDPEDVPAQCITTSSVQARTDMKVDVVTAGSGKENEMGPMIKDVPWRPF